METLLKRDKLSPQQTLGKFLIEDKFECYTLEDCVREIEGQPVSSWKIPGQTAIPRGRFRIQDTWSPKYGRFMLQLMGIEGYEGVRLHSGNKAEDTEGCILLGDVRFMTYIGASRVAVARVEAKIRDALSRKEEVWITVE